MDDPDYGEIDEDDPDYGEIDEDDPDERLMALFERAADYVGPRSGTVFVRVVRGPRGNATYTASAALPGDEDDVHARGCVSPTDAMEALVQKLAGLYGRED